MQPVVLFVGEITSHHNSLCGWRKLHPGLGMLKSPVLSRETCICIRSSIQDAETVSSFYESETLQHNFCVGGCSLESRSPSPHSLLHTYMSSHSHTLGNCNSWGGASTIQIPEPSSKTCPHPLLPPHCNATPGWCVDKSPGND